MVKNIVDKVNLVQNQAEHKKRVTRKRGYPDIGAKLVALKAEDLVEDDKFMCHICKTTFCRKQNLELHLRSHEYVMPKEKATAQYSRDMAFICPVLDCIHHDPARALSDITAIKKHYRRKHGEKKWKCSFCPKIYAVDADCKQHEKRHRNVDHHRECPRSSRGKEAHESHQGAISMRENLHPATSNGEGSSIIPPPTFFNNSSVLNINEPPPYYPELNCPSINQPSPAAPKEGAVSLLNINEPPPPFYPELEAELNYVNISAPVHNHEVAQSLAIEQNYPNMPTPIHYHEVVPQMQINSSSTFISEFELDLLASNSTIKFTDLLHYGIRGSPVDGAVSGGTILNPNSASSHRIVPLAISLNNFEQQRDDSYINTSLELNSQGFVPPAFSPNLDSAGLYQTMAPGTSRRNTEDQWTDLTMSPLWLNSQGFTIPPKQRE